MSQLQVFDLLYVPLRLLLSFIIQFYKLMLSFFTFLSQSLIFTSDNLWPVSKIINLPLHWIHLYPLQIWFFEPLFRCERVFLLLCCYLLLQTWPQERYFVLINANQLILLCAFTLLNLLIFELRLYKELTGKKKSVPLISGESGWKVIIWWEWGLWGLKTWF